MTKVQKKILWTKDNVSVGELIFKENKQTKIKQFIEIKRRVILIVPIEKNYEYMGWVKFPIFIFKAEVLKKKEQHLEFYEKINLIKVSRKKAKKIALNEMVEPHHSFALLKCLE